MQHTIKLNSEDIERLTTWLVTGKEDIEDIAMEICDQANPPRYNDLPIHVYYDDEEELAGRVHLREATCWQDMPGTLVIGPYKYSINLEKESA